MRIRVALPKADADKLRTKIVESAEKVETEESPADEWEAVSPSQRRYEQLEVYPLLQTMLIEPSQFRVINEILQKECKGRGRIETLTFAATATS